MGKIAILTGILVLACSGESSSDSPTQPTSCDPNLRNGTYLAHFIERPNGSCGAVPDELVRIDGADAVGDGCQLAAPDQWLHQGCTLSRSFTCTQASGYSSRTIALTKDQNGDGSLFVGRFTIEVYKPTGEISCLSTYDVVFTRQ